MFNILYNIIIYPIEFILEIVFYLFNNIFKSSYAVSLFALGMAVNFLSLPLYNVAENWQEKERDIQNKMKPIIDSIKKAYKGDQRYLLIRACQKINNYKTIYAFRGTLGLLIQIPFFIAAYNFINNLYGLELGNFLFIKDFSKPDELLKIGNFSVNILPFIMTLFSLLAGFIYSKKLTFKESLPLYSVSLIFLILLYNSPSGLLFYWTINCLFSLIKNIIIEYKLYNVFVNNKYKLLKAYNILFIVLTIIFILLISLSKIERKCYLSDFEFVQNRYGVEYNVLVKYYSKIFINSDLFYFIGNDKKFDDNIISINYYGTSRIAANVNLKDKIENINKDIIGYYKLGVRSYLINIYTVLLIIFILLNLYKINAIIFYNDSLKEIFEKNKFALYIICCLVISFLSGLFIPSSLIGNSPIEFSNPFMLILSTFSTSIGFFLFYPILIYLLFSDKIKNYLTLLFLLSVSSILINTFIMTGNYVNINNEFLFDNANYLKASAKEILITLLLTFISVSIIIFIIRKNKLTLIKNIYSIIFIVLIFISIMNIINISKEHAKLSKNKSYSSSAYNNKIFNFSKEGNNILFLLLDRAITSYWLDAMERFPEYKKELDGFIIYPNTVSLSGSTITTASLYGGYEYLPYELSISGTNILRDKHNEALVTIPLSLEKYNYKSILFEPVYAGFSKNYDLSALEKYTNISIYEYDAVYNYSLNNFFGSNSFDFERTSKLDQKNKSIRFSIFRMMPIHIRYNFYDNKNWFLVSSSFSRLNSSIEHYAILTSFTNFFNMKDNGNYYNSIYNYYTHEPYYSGSDFLPHTKETDINIKDLYIYKDESSVRHFYANVGAINSLIKIIKYLKENNIYDNTKIIVASDHGSGVTTTIFTNKNTRFISSFNSLLLLKDFNSYGEIKIDTNFMTAADIPYLTTKHIADIRNYFTGSIITNDQKSNGVNIIDIDSWKINHQLSNSYNFHIFYNVHDNIFDINNWKKFIADLKTKKVKEIDLK